MYRQLISYDLKQPARDYHKLFAAIKDCGSWWHCLESVWIVETQLTTTQVRDRLLQDIDSNDALLVSKLSGSWATYGISEECTNWLSSHL